MQRRSVPSSSDVDEVSARKVVPLHRLAGDGLPGDDRALGDALIAGHPGAAEALYDRYAGHVSRVLVRVMGVDAELKDLLHEVFVRALAQATRLDDPSRLKAWVTSIAVFTARGCIRHRRRSSWLGLASAEALAAAAPVLPAPHEARQVLRATYDVLGKLPSAERIPFALRFMERMELVEIAAACDVSLATIKRRLARAQKRFFSIARGYPALAGYLAETLDGGMR